MSYLYLYIASNEFESEEEFDRYIEPTITLEDVIHSNFMEEIGLSNYEPMCIERDYKTQERELRLLLKRFSYYKTWEHNLDLTKKANAIIAVYPPNEVETPQNCSLEFAGKIKYEEKL